VSGRARRREQAAHQDADLATVHLAGRQAVPWAHLGWRLLIALGLLVLVWMIAYLDADGYRDADGGELSLIDSLYYATVTISTTGYGDITPITDNARLVNAVVITPVRVLFLILLVGTTIEALAGRTHTSLVINRWRKKLRDHVIICGFGTKGQAALTGLRERHPDRQAVAVDQSSEALQAARRLGVDVVEGDATLAHVLEQAGIHEARAVIVAPDRDDTAVLMTITARELNPDVTIAASVREEENAHLVEQAGCDSVIVSSWSAGRLLGIATDAPEISALFNDLLSIGEGLDLVTREVADHEAGPLSGLALGTSVVAVLRDRKVVGTSDPEGQRVVPGDRLVLLQDRRSRPGESG
jgi:voltage-gated potassium channel